MRYGDQLDWRLVLIGLTERPEQYLERGYTPLTVARSYAGYRRYGMPFAPQVRSRVVSTGNDALDRPEAERALLELTADKRAHRRSLGDDTLWIAA